MKKTFGIFSLLLVVFLATAYMADSFLTPFNLENLIRRTSLFGIISIGVAFVIITGGIDLSIGSVICLVGCGLPFLLRVDYQPAQQAALAEINASQALRLYDSTAKNGGIYTVKQVGDKTLTLDPAPIDNDQRGSVVQVFPIDQSHSEQKTITLANAHLRTRDQVTFVEADGTVGQTSRITATQNGRYTIHDPPTATAQYIVGLHRHQRTSVPVALAMVLLVSLVIGLSHGYLVAKIKLQPFVVTLCGLLLYRGLTRGFTEDQTQGFQAEYPNLRLIATAKLGQLDYAQALGLFGGIIIAAGVGWLLWQRKKKAPAEERRWPIVPIVLGVAIALGGVYQAKHIPVIDVPAHETKSVKADLPLGARQISLEARDAGGWKQLDQQTIQPHDRPQEVTVPSLETLRQSKAGEWTAVRVVVTRRELPRIGIPAPCLILIGVAIAAGIFLNHTIYGRYLLALGRNEEAASGILFAFELDSVQPAQTGEFYELYAIAAAVLGGCSLRGGEGGILGVIIAAAVIRLIYNSINMLGISTHLEYAILGSVILAGVTVDELIKRYAAKRAAAKQQDSP